MDPAERRRGGHSQKLGELGVAQSAELVVVMLKDCLIQRATKKEPEEDEPLGGPAWILDAGEGAGQDRAPFAPGSVKVYRSSNQTLAAWKPCLCFFDWQENKLQSADYGLLAAIYPLFSPHYNH